MHLVARQDTGAKDNSECSVFTALEIKLFTVQGDIQIKATRVLTYLPHSRTLQFSHILPHSR